MAKNLGFLPTFSLFFRGNSGKIKVPVKEGIFYIDS